MQSLLSAFRLQKRLAVCLLFVGTGAAFSTSTGLMHVASKLRFNSVKHCLPLTKRCYRNPLRYRLFSVGAVAQEGLEDAATVENDDIKVDTRSKKQRRRERTEAEIEVLREERRLFLERRKEKIAKIAAGESGLGKVRQHVNPLAPGFREPCPTPEWDSIYQDLSKDLHLDIGCGKGHFLFDLAKEDDSRNHLGIEIREALPVRAQRWVQEEGLTNCYFTFGNINVSVESLLSGYPGNLELVTVMMPDPWFKKRHQKRRIIQPELVEALASKMKPGSRFMVQSDVLEAAENMVEVLDACDKFTTFDGNWIEQPLPIQTERETSCLSKGMPVYRALYTRL
mmetsp:Transcript_12472/g.19630  ORF Transcript_12472/g.19630 Transcript_12472/m.19630 type:complete len:339 (-) Transcript_12472:27-1043(-)|eukprot:CAMPEP_0184314560 /NCGR_PEP_ID=MMETSP1049-20130417/75356_1 /TAXON_ID=77928 /ORGANISM="Proteomonas sulcata, Strain CCMP704" /LENGTH=338 /DNA_ID=CAMNT_0026632541 /DNA_START=122 /DNA_END=1138 /DNA_ORIENTATION=-